MCKTKSLVRRRSGKHLLVIRFPQLFFFDRVQNAHTRVTEKQPLKVKNSYFGSPVKLSKSLTRFWNWIVEMYRLIYFNPMIISTNWSSMSTITLQNEHQGARNINYMHIYDGPYSKKALLSTLLFIDLVWRDCVCRILINSTAFTAELIEFAELIFYVW